MQYKQYPPFTPPTSNPQPSRTRGATGDDAMSAAQRNELRALGYRGPAWLSQHEADQEIRYRRQQARRIMPKVSARR